MFINGRWIGGSNYPSKSPLLAPVFKKSVLIFRLSSEVKAYSWSYMGPETFRKSVCHSCNQEGKKGNDAEIKMSWGLKPSVLFHSPQTGYAYNFFSSQDPCL